MDWKGAFIFWHGIAWMGDWALVRLGSEGWRQVT